MAKKVVKKVEPSVEKKTPITQEKVEKFYYSINRFQDLMKDYKQSMQNFHMAENRKRIAEKNEMGLPRSELDKALVTLTVFGETNRKDAVDKMKTAIEELSIIRDILH